MIPMFKPFNAPHVTERLMEVFDSGMTGEGPRVEEFKSKLEERFQCKNLIPLNNCTNAITLAGRLLDLHPGDEIISTPFTMIASNVALMQFGVTIKWADQDYLSPNIHTTDVARKVTRKTKAILVTQVGGIPCEMDILQSFGIPIISDCAHAITAQYHYKHISNWADYSCFSFQSIKQLNTGDGGAIVVKDASQFERAEKLKWFGMSRKVPEGMTRLEHQMTADVVEWGYKMHMNDIAAAIGLENLLYLDNINYSQQDNAGFYGEQLNGISGLTLARVPWNCSPSWWAYPIFVENRDSFMKMMVDKGIVTTPMWRRNDKYTVFKDMPKYDLRNMNKQQDTIVFIPVGWWVKPKDREYIVECIKGGW